MNPLLRKLMARYHAPADDGSDLGGDVLDIEDDGTDGESEDRGDVLDAKPTKKAAPEPEDEPAAHDDDDGASSGKPAGIPKSRFNEVNDQRKAAEQRAEAAERELAALREAAQRAQTPAKEEPQAPAFDEDAKEEEYGEALMNGDTKLAASIRREINAYVRAEATAQARQMSHADYEQRAIASALQAESDLAIQTYPYLNTEEGADALEMIIALRDSKIAKGIAPHAALRAAVNSIGPKFAPDDDSTPRRVLTGGAAKVDSRPSAALARGAADSIAQPPSVQAGIGNRANTARINVEELSDEQFAALSKEEKKRLRGD